MARESGTRVAPGHSLQLRGRAGVDLIACPGCHELKAPEEWVKCELDLDPLSPPPVCDSCRSDGVPPRIRTFAMPLNHQLALKAFMGETNPQTALRAASKASGLKQSTIKQMIAGRRAPEFRRSFQLCLEAMGLDLVGIASLMAECAGATESKWNPKEEKFNSFIDHRTRLNTAKAAARLLELEAPKHASPGQVNIIKIDHNLGGGDEISPPNVLEVKPIPESVDVEPA